MNPNDDVITGASVNDIPSPFNSNPDFLMISLELLIYSRTDFNLSFPTSLNSSSYSFSSSPHTSLVKPDIFSVNSDAFPTALEIMLSAISIILY